MCGTLSIYVYPLILLLTNFIGFDHFHNQWLFPTNKGYLDAVPYNQTAMSASDDGVKVNESFLMNLRDSILNHYDHFNSNASICSHCSVFTNEPLWRIFTKDLPILVLTPGKLIRRKVLIFILNHYYINSI